MTIEEMILSLPPAERARLVYRLEGMEMARRICRNRARDLDPHIDAAQAVGGDMLPPVVRQNEAETCAEVIRTIQVAIGSGRMDFGDLTQEEKEELSRIA